MRNSRDVLSVIPEEERARPNLDLDLDDFPVERTLGVQWAEEKDVFLFKVLEPNQPLTKRGILSAVSSLYDPMGFVCPIVLEAKKILQKLWKLNLGWDDEIPEDLQCHWDKWKNELPVSSQVQIPRCHLADQTEVLNVSLHLFTDLFMQVKLSNGHSWLEGLDVRLRDRSRSRGLNYKQLHRL